ncbi:MAG: MetQ/NlpA family ABC transporter substrate-binding protein [Noviherbaspirillum sp.]
MRLSIVKILARTFGALALAAAVQVQSAPLKIGVTPGALADSVNVAAQEARKQGLEVEVIEFSDWTTPNLALANKDLDANYFQHQAFLDNAVKERGYAFQVVGVGVLSNIGLYSKRIKQISELKSGATVAVASDPVNQGRGLLLLQKAGVIKLRDGVGTRGSLRDVVDNPKKVKILEIEGPQLVRAIDDVDLAQGYPGHLVAAGTIDPGSALLLSGVEDNYFAIRFVSRQDNAADPRLQRFVRIYQESPLVRAQLRKSHGNNDRLFALPWLAGS